MRQFVGQFQLANQKLNRIQTRKIGWRGIHWGNLCSSSSSSSTISPAIAFKWRATHGGAVVASTAHIHTFRAIDKLLNGRFLVFNLCFNFPIPNINTLKMDCRASEAAISKTLSGIDVNSLRKKKQTWYWSDPLNATHLPQFKCA